jgi:tol-pal system protein YbgF
MLGSAPGAADSARDGAGRNPSADTDGADAVLPEGPPREQYAHAFNLMHNKRFDEAEAAYKAFLERHPDDPLAENAHYWLGETYYARQDYAAAAGTFLAGYEKFKTGAKAPDTLLKLGMALARLDKTPEACASFAEIERAFPDAPSAILGRAEAEARQAGCR